MASFESQEHENKQIVRQFFELLDRHDIERMADLLVSNTNYSFHLAGMPSPVDWNEHKRLLAGVINAFPDLHHDIVDMVAERDKVAVRLNVTGTHKGEFQGILPTGKKLSLHEMGFITILDGKIIEGWDKLRHDEIDAADWRVTSISSSSSSLAADSSSTACS